MGWFPHLFGVVRSLPEPSQPAQALPLPVTLWSHAVSRVCLPPASNAHQPPHSPRTFSPFLPPKKPSIWLPEVFSLCSSTHRLHDQFEKGKKEKKKKKMSHACGWCLYLLKLGILGGMHQLRLAASLVRISQSRHEVVAQSRAAEMPKDLSLLRCSPSPRLWSQLSHHSTSASAPGCCLEEVGLCFSTVFIKKIIIINPKLSNFKVRKKALTTVVLPSLCFLASST